MSECVRLSIDDQNTEPVLSNIESYNLRKNPLKILKEDDGTVVPTLRYWSPLPRTSESYHNGYRKLDADKK
ncbi:hypothetical protein TWF102_005200 [Orbilia oligospora]|uniref:Uncharacterized protein n=1 Tax=Orbilia oligospora TaxID=2813651 RepID=A0A7C8N8R2_ORBOL|nr:hypothetical protein TWF102_005200 [Orbilia oligospora]KAF3140136.1 hypothetical protein TWF594_006524 [Orbilia oligospora]